MKIHSVHNQQVIEELMSYKNIVFRICLGFSRDAGEAEDLTQDTYLKAYHKLDSLKNPDCTEVKKGWLCKIAKNTCLDYIKKQKHRLLFQSEPGTEAVEHKTPEGLAAHQQEIQRLKSIIRQLPKKQRVVFILKEYAQLSYKEIAAVLDIKDGTLMSRLNRARKTVIKKMRS